MIATKDAILAMLIREEGFVSGEAVGEALGISRAAVGNAVKALRETGYEIESVTNRGYRLQNTPDLLNAGEMHAFLDEARMERVVCLQSIDSTNRYLAQMALDGAPDGQIAVADRQTAGRGRLSRAFHSPGGMGVYFSYLIRPGAAVRGAGKQSAEAAAGEMLPSAWTQVTSMTAVAVSDAVENVCGVRPKIKWVNDLYLDAAETAARSGSGRQRKAAYEKICGILTQMDVEPDTGHVRSVIIGIGVNVAERKSDFPKEIRDIAGSVYTATGKRVMRAQLAAEMTRAMDAMRASLPDKEGAYLARYRAASILPGMDITVIAGEKERRAKAIAVGDDYALRVRYTDGTEESLRGGEVSIRY